MPVNLGSGSTTRGTENQSVTKFMNQKTNYSTIQFVFCVFNSLRIAYLKPMWVVGKNIRLFSHLDRWRLQTFFSCKAWQKKPSLKKKLQIKLQPYSLIIFVRACETGKMSIRNGKRHSWNKKRHSWNRKALFRNTEHENSRAFRNDRLPTIKPLKTMTETHRFTARLAKALS